MTFLSLSDKQKKALGRLAPFACCAAVFVAFLACAVLVWYQYFMGLGEKTERYLLNDVYTDTIVLTEGVCITQDFETTMPMYQIALYFERLSDTVDGSVVVTLENLTTGALLLNSTGNIATVYYDVYTPFTLDSPITTWGSTDTYRLSVTAYYTAETNQLAVKIADSTVDKLSNLTVDGAAHEGALTMMLTYEMLGDTPVQCYFVLSFLFALCAAGLCYLCFFAKGKFALTKPWLAFVVILVVGVFYQFALPPFSAPDEISHYNTAYGLTNNWFGLTPETEGATLVKRKTDAQYTFVDYRTDAFTYRHIAEHFFEAPDGTYVEESPTLLGPYYLPYYLSAIGLAIGQLLGWGGVLTTFFARGLNLLFFAGCAALSIHLVPFGKKIIAAVALLPIALHIGGSFSYDSCLLSISFLILALGLRLIDQKGKAHWVEVAAFVILCFLVGPLKMAYFPLTFLAVLIPTARFGKRWVGYLVRFGTPVLSFLHFCAWHFIAIYVQLMVTVDIETAVENVNTGVVEVVSGFTVSTLLSHPGLALRLVVNTFFTNFTSYLTSMLGGTLGYQDISEVNLNILLVAGFGLLLLFACIKRNDAKALDLAPIQRITFGFCALCVLGILVIACFSWTLVTYDVLWGFQGRYLLPALGFALFALRPNGITTEGDCFHGMLFAGFVLNFMALLNVVSITFLR
ncbi:MAG: DUF2142 domain-containing protein [Faecalibacterium sp.]